MCSAGKVLRREKNFKKSAMKICAVILIALCVSSTTSVTLTGEYVNLQWYKGGPTKFALQVEGVSVYKPNDFTVGINAGNTYGAVNILTVVMDFNNMKYMPANYTRLVTGIQNLVVRNSRVKYITNADFLGLKALTYVDFSYNEIEFLPGNLFQGVSTVLGSVLFANNKITNIAPTFIANIKGLKTLNLSTNPCINNISPPTTIAAMNTIISSSCQKPVSAVPDVPSGPPPTYEEYNALKDTNVASKKTIDNLTSELKLRNDKIKELEASLVATNSASMKCFEDKSKLLLDLNAANDDILKRNVILENNLKVSKMQSDKIMELTNSQAELEKCKLSSKKMEADLKEAQNNLQTMKLTNDMNKKTIDDLNKNIETLKSENMKIVDAQKALAAKEILNKEQLAKIDEQMKKIADLEKVLSDSQSKLGNVQAAYHTLFNKIYD
ncbi:unnamed protein product [Diamesa hyperborea]